MNFFRYFPNTAYSFPSDTSGPFDVTITNITAHVVILELLKKHITVFYNYLISDGERPDSVATKLYGGPEYTWIVLVLNNILSHYDWPLTFQEFNQYITVKYGSVVAAQAQPVYKTTEEFLIDAVSYDLLPAERQGRVISQYDYEQELNETKRRIKAIPLPFVGPILIELKQALA
jgi:hypothetical protein